MKNQMERKHSDDGDRHIQAVFGGQSWSVSPDKKSKGRPCVWTHTGRGKFKSCNNFYDCPSCKYDHAMNKRVEEGKQQSWQDAMRARPAMDRVCRHTLAGRIETRVCAYNYECKACDFDQFFEETWSAKTKRVPSEIQRVRGFDVPMGHYYHDGHTWARIESGGNIRVGLDDFALKLLGEADALDLPLMGKELDQGTPNWGFKRRERHADVLSPVDGVILEVNPKVRENPGVANRDPFGDGWLFLVKTPHVKKTIKNLMDDTRGMEWISSEVSDLEGMIEETAGPMAADGGVLGPDIYGALPDLGWKNLASRFLKT
ncbi:conserved hypothetical protein [Candidatus Desulfarcum epimagneticum]|uniref:Glycine cleavage system protein H n=1 Tax=uncultured Desulfobacteraceae bacterium TaxID=218296 RepID=A0A484HL80_9BACT|nr:conserved hypothetical protein [uncultured Desulfobacteraceae bacterium]